MKTQVNIAVCVVLAVLTILVGLCGCQKNTKNLTNEQRTAIARDVNQIVTSIYESASKRDLTIYNHFSDSTTGIFSGTIMASWEEHKRQMADFFSAQEKIESELEIVDTDVLSSTTAVVLAKSKVTATNKAGVTYNSPTTCITYVFNKTNGQWKIVHFHDSEPKE
jgi:ketosteroid isomerase-like protein